MYPSPSTPDPLAQTLPMGRDTWAAFLDGYARGERWRTLSARLGLDSWQPVSAMLTAGDEYRHAFKGANTSRKAAFLGLLDDAASDALDAATGKTPRQTVKSTKDDGTSVTTETTGPDAHLLKTIAAIKLPDVHGRGQAHGPAVVLNLPSGLGSAAVAGAITAGRSGGRYLDAEEVASEAQKRLS